MAGTRLPRIQNPTSGEIGSVDMIAQQEELKTCNGDLSSLRVFPREQVLTLSEMSCRMAIEADDINTLRDLLLCIDTSAEEFIASFRDTDDSPVACFLTEYTPVMSAIFLKLELMRLNALSLAHALRKQGSRNDGGRG